MIALLAIACVAAAAFATVSAPGRDVLHGRESENWVGLVGSLRSALPTTQRMIVVLKTPSLAQRLAKVRYATEAQERTWSSSAFAAQQQVLAKLATLGVSVRPDFSYARVLDGFAAALDPRAVALLDSMPEVAGVYPVRAAYPASVSETLLTAVGEKSGASPDVQVPGFDGHGVTIALLDTGVDLSHPFLRERVLPGIDIVDNDPDSSARANPLDTNKIEDHGTEVAGLLVGSQGPGGLHGVAPGATILPIRVAGWQPAANGAYSVYSRSDQLIEGLERAVDPNGDGDAHDAARVALVGVAEPYAAFTDGPEALATQGALDLNTVVVAPAGNDGAAGPSFGSIAGPAGSPAAIAVGATDGRPELRSVRVVLRRGLDVILDEELPLLGALAPTHSLSLRVATPNTTTGLKSTDWFGAHGRSRVAGQAALVPAGEDPRTAAAAAARAGAAAVVLYGDALPAGGLGVDENQLAPVVIVPTASALELLAARRAGIDVGIAIGHARSTRNAGRGLVAGFSSEGLAFDGAVKPNLVAPGTGLATSEPGAAPDGSPLYVTVNGTSVSAATVAGAAAILAQMRPSLAGASLASLLVGYAQRGGASATSAGAGTLRLGASAVGEVAAQPTTLGFGLWQGPRWHGTRTLVVRNVSSRRLQFSVRPVVDGESEAVGIRVVPDHLTLGPGRAAPVKVTLTAPKAPATPVLTGALEIAPAGEPADRVPWSLGFGVPNTSLITSASIDRPAFSPSDTDPAVLTVQAGGVSTRGGVVQVRPVARLDILLYTATGRFVGVMARLRDLLPGSFSFGITGRGPTSIRLAPGHYELRLAAWPTLPRQAVPSRAKVGFQIE